MLDPRLQSAWGLAILAIYYQEQGEQIVVSGKTYPYREQIKSLGGRFQSQSKVWLIPFSNGHLQDVKELCKRVGGGALKAPSSSAPAKKPSTGIEAKTQAAVAPAETKPSQGWTVQELVYKAQLAIAQEFPQAVWILGEIHSLSKRARAIYLQLADPKEKASKSATVTVNATLWHESIQSIQRKLGKDKLDDILQDGLKIRVLAQVSLYKDRASLSVNILDIDPNYTKGSLALQREELLRELRSKGLDRKNPSLNLARFPFRIGLISADNSRAKSDFLDQLSLFRCPVHVLFKSARMQGDATLEDVKQGIQELNRLHCDLIVITRGGGSMADLRWFDSREIALAIADSSIPILAAIGHHEDVCVAEEISFRREKTPTAAADFIISHFQQTEQTLGKVREFLSNRLIDRLYRDNEKRLELLKKLSQASQRQLTDSHMKTQTLHLRFQQAFQQASQRHEKRLDYCQQQLSLRIESRLQSEGSSLDRMQQRLMEFAKQKTDSFSFASQKLAHQLEVATSRYIQDSQQKLMDIEKQLAVQDPKPWLSRGWTQLLANGKRIRSIQDIAEKDQLKAEMVDGSIELEVKSIKKRDRHD